MIRKVFVFGRKIKEWYNWLYNTALLKAESVHYITRPIVNGQVIITNKGSISLGTNVLINNTSESNPVGLPHATILHTKSKDAKITIGDNVGISGSSIVADSEIVIGHYVLIGGGCGIWDTDFHPTDYKSRQEHATKKAKSRKISIGDHVFIGARSIILKGVTIGQGAVISAGTVVNKDIPANAVAYGNPMIIKQK